ncbi:unnamed protein product [Adineta steineri]|uniref:Fibulin-1 n=1 Tax=Adineta steineri TaxID=433720 RepID=A0A815SH86_9BILA|nr:unnamed protein product [Adineta steineri]CAF1270416.1 unnamed protein product [Adineta steineri]CAF1491071.1 unnamed protein product [Adineta steineri]CAF1492356.1 unnamed protein product [Adineta steineri]CAF3844582.1 unnamed protein product [Adineta steineri]
MYIFSNIIISFLGYIAISSILTDAFRNNAEECCQTGRIQAESTKTCTTTLQSLITENNTTLSANCRFLAHICCLSNLRHYFCEEGLKTALRLIPCNDTKLESKDTYQICCKCCELGVRAGREHEDCEPVTVLDERCGEQFTNCCKKAKSLNCDSGFEMGDSGRCHDINECLSSPCANTMKCENTPGSYRCVEGCDPGYIWSLKQGECRDIDECALSRHNCSYGHRCENMPGSYRCIRERNCGTGYQVDPITQTCIDIDECEQDIDEPGYLCKNLPGTYKCAPQNCTFGEKFNAFFGRCEKIQCQPGYNVTALSKCVDINECAQKPSPCKMGERCDNTPGSYKCVQTFACANGLEMQDLQCLDIDECELGNHTCLPPATCKNTYGSFYCQCPPGFIFKYGACVDDDECGRGNSICPTNSFCRNTPGSYACDCIGGYKMLAERAFCEDIDECQISPDTCEQKCINVQGSYYCLCKEGYRLNGDKRTCRDLDECSMIANLCQYHCVNTPGSYKCICPSGFSLERGRQCQDIDECQLNTHHCRAEDVCVNLRGSYRCYFVDCPKGYDKLGNSRCQLSARWCNENQNDTNLRCTISKPVKIVYSFVALPAKIRVPTEIFRIRNSQLTANQHAEFDLRLINARDPYTNQTQTTFEHFQLKRFPPHNAHLSVIKELNALQEIELNIEMKIYTNNLLNSISIMKILIYVSQYDFYP